jgi:hypothetical protein
MSNESQARDDLVHRLLGPAGPELDCDKCFEQLDRFVELEVAGRGAGEAIPGMRAHLDGCPACREDYESLRALVEAGA